MSLDKWSPYYQRLIQKAAAHDDNQTKFVNSALTNPIFQQMAGDEMLRNIQQMQLAATKLAQKQNLDFSRESTAAARDIRDKQARMSDKDAARAERIATLGLGGSFITGGLDLYGKKKQADRINAMTSILFGGVR